MFINPILPYSFKVNNLQKNTAAAVSAPALRPLPFDTVSFGKKLPMEESAKLFDDYNPQIKRFSGYSVPVHNNEIAAKLKSTYTASSFDDLFKFADEKKVFNLTVDPQTHFIKTSGATKEENFLMGRLVWVTDTCNLMPLLKVKHPELCVPLMEKFSDYYKKQHNNLNKIINNPGLYRLKNGCFPKQAQNGPGHVFYPETLKTNHLFPRTRLESHGKYVLTMCNLIKEGFDGAPYGYKSSSEISDNTLQAIADITRFLQRVGYSNTKDCGPWEFETYNSTTTSSVAIINEAYRNVLDLMYSPTDNKELLKVRKRILEQKNGKIFEKEEALRNQLYHGELRVKYYNDEIAGERALDGAMSVIPHTEKLDKNPATNAVLLMKKLERLEGKDGIVRSNGVLRYKGDTYLFHNSGLMENTPFHPTAPVPSKSEAQWFMSSDMSKGYGVIAKNLLNEVEKNKKSDKNISELLKKALKKETEYINRSYARITGENSYKANGNKCHEFSVPEAYQSVSDSKGKIKFVPGTHTPLAWAQASLYDASAILKENLQRYEKLKAFI